MVPGGRLQPEGGPSDVERGVKTGLGALQKALKPAGQLMDRFSQPGTFDRGQSEGAFQQQRAGERQDFGSALPALDQPTMPGVFSNFPNAGVPATTPLAPDTTFSMMPSSSGQIGGIAPGASAPTGGMGISTPSGWTGSAGQIGGVAAGGLGTALAAYNLAQAIQAGNPAGIAAGALGTATGAGATAAAAGSQTAGALMGAVAAPLAVAAPVIMAVMAYLSEDDRKNMVEKLRQMNMRNTASVYEGGVNQANDLQSQMQEILPVLSPQGQQAFVNTASNLLAPSDQQSSKAMSPVPFSALESIGRMRYGDSAQQLMPGTDTTYGANADIAAKPYPELYKDLAYTLMKNPNLAMPSFNAEKTGDINSDIASLNGAGGAAKPGDYQGYYSLLPGLPSPYVDQAPGAAEIAQGNTTPSKVANPALGGQFSPEVLQSPFYAQEYWQSQGITPQMAMLYGLGMNVNNAKQDLAPHMQDAQGLETLTPDFIKQQYDPAALYQYLTTQGGLSPVTSGATAPAGASQTGDMSAGGQNVGGAGKLSPTFATPELDRVAEITSAGKRQGPGMQQQQPGRPFGMGQRPQPQGGTFGQRGGMAVGQGPFGMARPNAPQIARNSGGNV